MSKIFFAHSDPKLIGLYGAHFTPHFSFDSASDGLHALRKIRIYLPDLVVSDYDLPSLSGLSLLKYIRTHENLHSIPFIFLSDHQDLASGLSFGASDWVPRKTNPDVLLHKIYHHLIKV